MSLFTIPRLSWAALALLGMLAAAATPASPLSGFPTEKGGSPTVTLLLADKGATTYVIHVDAGATAAEKGAAAFLAARLTDITGAAFPVVEAPTSGMRGIIAVGPAAAKRLSPSLPLDLSALGHDGVVMRTEGGALLLTGAQSSRRGTVYAVGLFLEKLGCRWWTESASTLPKISSLSVPSFSLRYRPGFEYRELLSYFATNFAVENRLNGNGYPIPESRGGSIKYRGPYFVHTFAQIVPPKEYFAGHPQWFSEIQGKRINKSFDGQLCLSPKNGDLLALVIGKVKGYLADAPPDSIVSVSQNDGAGACECADCRAIEAEEGSPAGPVVRFVNAVAKAIEAEYPQATIDTLAYLYSQKPPALTGPRANVRIRLCPFKCRWLAPYDSKANAAFFADLQGWRKWTSNLHVWDYTTDFADYHSIFPNLYVSAGNLRLFASNQVRGLMHQGTFNTPGGDLAVLKDWVFAKLLWDPSLDERALVSEFVAGYYGPAASAITRYLDLVYAGDPMQQNHLLLSFMEKAYPLYLEGRTLAGRDPELLRRVELAFMPMLNVLLVNWTSYRQQAAGGAWPFPAEPAELADAFVRIGAENGVRFANEARTSLSAWVKDYRIPGRMGKTAPEFEKIPPVDKREIQDDRFRLYKKGELVFTVADESASDGFAASMPGSHTAWAVQVDLPTMPAKPGASGRWKVYAAVKVVKQGDQGLAFTAGVYDLVEKKNPASIEIALPQVAGEGYHLYAIGTVVPGAKYIWVAPAKNAENAKEIRVDRLMLVRE